MIMKKLYFFLPCLLSIGFLLAQPAPDFTVTDAHGNQHQLYADYLNQGKTVVIKLFFVACPPCNQIAPDTETLYQDWGGTGNPDVEFFSITIQSNDNDADVLSYENTHGLTYPGISADGGALAAGQPYRNGTYGQFPGTPTFIVIAPDGTVNFDVFGPGISATITAIDNAIRDTRPAVIPNKTITLQIEDALNNNDDFIFSVEDDGQSFAPDMGTDNAFTVPAGANYDISVDPVNISRTGVSTFDLILIAKHITGQNIFDSPKKIIAADLNNTQSITTFDVIELRKYILFINQDFPNTPHWRTLPADFLFTDPTDPWLDDFESKQIQNLQDDVTYGINPIRVGDVNNSTWDNLSDSPAETRSGLNQELSVKDKFLQAGSVYSIPITAKDFTDIIGYQFALNLDPEQAELLTVIPNKDSGLTSAHYYHNNNQVTFSWFDLERSTWEENLPLFQLQIKAKRSTSLSRVLSLNDQLLKGEAYPLDGEAIDRIELVFNKTNSAVLYTDLQVFPNPMKDKGLVKYQIEQAGQVEVEIVSLTGRVVQKLESSYRVAGQYTLPIRPLDRGMYFIRLIQNGEKSITKRIAVF